MSDVPEGFGQALSKAMREWLPSPAGAKLCDPETLNAPADYRVYLNNRLQTAFIAGADFAAEFCRAASPAAPPSTAEGTDK